jgi:hypothetical protein
MPAFQTTFEELTQSWEFRLQNAEAGESDQLARLETCIRICEESLLQLRQWVTERSFDGRDCEIYFFKRVKPVIMARYIYYQKVYRLHIGYFNGNGLLEKERLEQELKDIARYFADNAGFYSYYRMGCIHHDELYFIRGAHDWKICPEINHFDAVFSTSCDGKLAELMARELLLKYIDGMLNPSVKLIEPVAVTVSSPAMKLYPMPPYPMRLFAQCRYAYVEASIPALRHTLLAKALCAGAAAGRLRRCGYGNWLVEVLFYC